MSQQLVDAVKRGDVQAVGDLLSAGHSVYTMGDEYGGGLLHVARHASMVKLLVSHGAVVCQPDMCRKTPLWRAIADNKSADCIKALLEDLANLNRIIYEYNNTTALHKAVVDQHKDLSVLRLLLDFGANININIQDSSYCYNSHVSALDYSFYDVNCSRMLIRFQVLRRGPLDLEPHTNQELHDELVQYQDLCKLEVARMRTEVLGCSGGADTLTLYQFMVAKSPRPRTWAQSISDALLERYPLYSEDIRAFREATLERSRLLKDLDGVQMSATGQDGVWLNNDCMLALARYLSDEELRNLVAASQVDDQDC